MQRKTPYPITTFTNYVRPSMTELAPPSIPEGAENVSLRGFNHFIGPIWQLSRSEDGMSARFAFVPDTKHMNGAGSVHGGMLMAFADISMSRTAREGRERGSNTVSLTADFVGPGKQGELIEAHVRVSRRTRTLVFMSADIMAGDRMLLVATGVWKLA
jgi:uncharacterized protein (TIGR00369 family)